MGGESDATFAVGDMHGRSDLLGALQRAIAQDAAASGAARPKVVYLGDYIDRGPDSKGVLDLVLNGLPGFERVLLRGNHEDMLASFLDRPGDENARNWYLNGGAETLASYGLAGAAETVGGDPRRLRDLLASRMPPEHRALVETGLGLIHEDRDAVFVHAGLNPRLAVADQSAEDMLWIREAFLDSDRDWGKPVVHGHTVSPFGPEVRRNRVNIDTGAFRSGSLTAVLVGPEGPRFLVAAQPCEWSILVDPEGVGGADWISWSAARAASSGARLVGLCLPGHAAAAAAFAPRGVATKPLPLADLAAKWADPAMSLGAAIASGRVSVSFSCAAARETAREAVRAAAPAAGPAPSA